MEYPFHQWVGVLVVLERCMKLLYLLCFLIAENVSIYFSYIESGYVISTRNEQSIKQPLAEV